jgi:hypothetical protein
MHKIPILIKAIGSERTSRDLIPWLEENICSEIPKFEDEILLALTEELEKHWNKFNLRDERTAFFKILSKLC